MSKIEEYKNNLRRLIELANEMGYPPQSVANDIIILAANDKKRPFC